MIPIKIGGRYEVIQNGWEVLVISRGISSVNDTFTNVYIM